MIKHTYKINNVKYTKELSPLKAIRLNCLECSGGLSEEVRQCPITTCPVYPFRFGKDPSRNPMKLSDDQRAALRERFEKIRKKPAE